MDSAYDISVAEVRSYFSIGSILMISFGEGLRDLLIDFARKTRIWKDLNNCLLNPLLRPVPVKFVAVHFMVCCSTFAPHGIPCNLCSYWYAV